MQKNKKKDLILVVCVIFLLSAACGIPTAPLTESTPPNEPTTKVITNTPSIVPTQVLSQAPTVTPQSQNTTQPTEVVPSITPTISGAIDSENVTNLTAMDPLPIPEWPQRLLWPDASVPIPGDPAPRPELLSNSGSNLYPVTIEPPAVGSLIPLPLNGNQILDFAPDASSLVVQDPSQTGVYTMQGELLWLITQPSQPYGANYSPDGRLLAVTSSQNWEVTIYNVANGQQITQLTGFETAAPVYNAIITSDGKKIAYYARATLQFQDVESGQLGQRIGFEDFIVQILFSPDGQRLIVSAAGKLMIYDPGSSQQLAELTLSDTLRALAISPNGKVLAGIYGQQLQFWDGSTLAPITTIQPSVSLAQISFSADGKHLVSLSNENELTIWHIP